MACVVHADLGVHADGRATHQGLEVLHAGAVDGLACGVVVGAVQHHVGLCHRLVEPSLVGTLGMRVHAHLGVDGGHGLGQGVDFVLAHTGLGVGDLALQVGQLDRVGVHHRELSHARAAQVQGGG